MSGIAVIIPARLGSTRLPEKALADIHGKPMVVRVAELAKKVKNISRILVATDSEKIASVVKKYGFEAIMTPSELASGSDRVAFVAKKLSDDIIVNLQGDEPMMHAQAISESVKYVVAGLPVGTCRTPLKNFEEYQNPNSVKVIVDEKQTAIFFSRSPIPYVRNFQKSEKEVIQDSYLGRHLGIYAYERNFLLQLSAMPQTQLEIRESLEQLRVLYHGYKIGVGSVPYSGYGVDTKEDLEKVCAEYKP